VVRVGEDWCMWEEDCGVLEMEDCSVYWRKILVSEKELG
jgi:hypothetical protein